MNPIDAAARVSIAFLATFSIAFTAPALAQGGGANSSAVVSVAAADTEWPQTLSRDGYTFVIARPAFQSINGTAVNLVANLVVTQPGGTQNQGTLSLMGFTATGDRPQDIEINQLSVEQVQMPNGGDARAAQTALSSLMAGLAVEIDRRLVAQQMTIDPITTPGLGAQMPDIVQRSVPTVLVQVAGVPQLAPLAGTGWARVTNTPFILIQNPAKAWFVRLGQGNWKSSPSMDGPWSAAAAPDAAVTQALGVVPTPPAGLNDAAAKPPSAIPSPSLDILVATRPTVLIASNGAAQFTTVCEGVQQMTNTNSTVLRTLSPAADWVLASGRWFQRAQGTTMWQFVPPAQLPPSFANLPSTGSLASARASVPGTLEAKSAVLAACQTQTVTLLRSKAVCGVRYIGAPQFASITGTSMQYATNASVPVIQSGSTFYCCDDAAWFTASGADGPWVLCDTLPASFADITAACPVYCATYVDPVSSTADSVTFAYTSGYLGTYLNGGTAVFGTGVNYPTAALAQGQSQTYPQTYGSDNEYDENTGTYAPDYDYYDEYPAVQPAVYGYGYGGWGYSSAWTRAWGWGVGHDAWWNHDNWNSFHPYGNRWADGYSDWQRDQNRLSENRRADMAATQRTQAQRANEARANPNGEMANRAAGAEGYGRYTGFHPQAHADAAARGTNRNAAQNHANQATHRPQVHAQAAQHSGAERSGGASHGGGGGRR
ncbi:MAG: hypothetical protein K8R92_10115 [Planctomycetes bacterium]|nr:hypothetical protein [Planctomycetota bacterium]